MGRCWRWEADGKRLEWCGKKEDRWIESVTETAIDGGEGGGVDGVRNSLRCCAARVWSCGCARNCSLSPLIWEWLVKAPSLTQWDQPSWGEGAHYCSRPSHTHTHTHTHTHNKGMHAQRERCNSGARAHEGMQVFCQSCAQAKHSLFCCVFRYLLFSVSRRWYCFPPPQTSLSLSLCLSLSLSLSLSSPLSPLLLLSLSAFIPFLFSSPPLPNHSGAARNVSSVVVTWCEMPPPISYHSFLFFHLGATFILFGLPFFSINPFSSSHFLIPLSPPWIEHSSPPSSTFPCCSVGIRVSLPNFLPFCITLRNEVRNFCQFSAFPLTPFSHFCLSASPPPPCASLSLSLFSLM